MTKVVVLTFVAVTFGVALTLLPMLLSKEDVVMKTFGEMESTRNSAESLEPPAIITITSIIVPGLIAGFLAFILTKRLTR
ncbi:MAG: hypothetical protein QXP86_03760 [Nitrososphaerota archaeon]